jgi:hypothetical protein
VKQALHMRQTMLKLLGSLEYRKDIVVYHNVRVIPEKIQSYHHKISKNLEIKKLEDLKI